MIQWYIYCLYEKAYIYLDLEFIMDLAYIISIKPKLYFYSDYPSQQ